MQSLRAEPTQLADACAARVQTTHTAQQLLHPGQASAATALLAGIGARVRPIATVRRLLLRRLPTLPTRTDPERWSWARRRSSGAYST